MNQDENSENKANEPLPKYRSNEITFFKSFEEMNEHDAKEMAQFTPVERLQHITEYIMHTYSDALKTKMDLTIYFK